MDGTFRLSAPVRSAEISLLVGKDGYAPCRLVAELERAMEITLDHGITIEGTVTGPSGDGPIPGAEVALRGWNEVALRLAPDSLLLPPEQQHPGGFVNWVRTVSDAEGRFRVRGLQGRWFHLDVRKPGFLPRPFLGDCPWPNFVRPEDSPLDLRMIPVYACAWDVRDASTGKRLDRVGWVIENADPLVAPPPELVARWPAGPQYWLSPESRRATGDGLAPGPVRVHVQRVGYVTTTISLPRVTFEFSAPPPSLEVFLKRTAESSGVIEVRIERPPWAADIPVSVRIRSQATSSRSLLLLHLREAGSPVRTELPAGAYTVQVVPEADKQDLLPVQAVGVGETRDVGISPDVPAVLSFPLNGGTLELDARDSRGKGVEGATIFLSEDGETSGWGVDALTVPEAGIYRLQLSPGRHELAVDKPGFRRATVFAEVVRDALTRVSATLVPDVR